MAYFYWFFIDRTVETGVAGSDVESFNPVDDVFERNKVLLAVLQETNALTRLDVLECIVFCVCMNDFMQGVGR